MLNWFLDLEIVNLVFLYVFFILTPITLLMAKKELSFSAVLGVQTILALIILFPIILPTITLKHYKTFDLKQEYYDSSFNITFGEAWCVYKDYTGELCKDYVIYVLDEQNIAEQKKREIELELEKETLEKQQKLDKETLRKNKILINYEKLIEEIKKSEKDKK